MPKKTRKKRLAVRDGVTNGSMFGAARKTGALDEAASRATRARLSIMTFSRFRHEETCNGCCLEDCSDLDETIPWQGKGSPLNIDRVEEGCLANCGT